LACSTHARDEKCIQNIGRKTRKEEKLGDLDVDGEILLRRILKKQHMSMWNGFVWYRIGISTTGGYCENVNEASGSIKCWKFLDQLKEC